MRIPHLWEPEETVGSAWADLVAELGAEPRHEAAQVGFDEVKASIGVLFRALGGAAGAEILPSAATVSKNRVALRRRLAHDVDHVTRASFDGQTLALPRVVSLFAEPRLNRGLYLWLAAIAARIEAPQTLPTDPLQIDLTILRLALAAESETLAACPGFVALRGELGAALLAQREAASLPPLEAEFEAGLRALLEGAASDNRFAVAIRDRAIDLATFAAPPDYKPFRPVALWPLVAAPRPGEGGPARHEPNEKGEAGEGSEKTLKAQRRASDQADRKDPFILHRFESIMSWVEFLNINRSVEDEDEDNAKKAAQDLDEVTLASHSKSAKTKLKFHLDLSPRDVDRARLVAEFAYPEWDWKAGSYLPDHVRVEERLAEEGDESGLERPRTRRRIERVRRQFEALRPRRRIVRRQPDGFDLDLDEAVRARCDLMASGEAGDRLYMAIRNDERDLAVAVLIDVSRSTESAVSGRPVIDIEKEALAALISGVEACGDAVAAYAFSSLRRERVTIETVKDFEEPIGPLVRRRIMGLTPKFYTRLGGAIRHVSTKLAARPAERRLMLVITDGKPNDLDHYEGRHGVEDTRRAVSEARRLGQAVFAVTVDARAQDYIPYLFGQNGFAIVRDAEHLIEALPDMYRHVAG